MDGASKDELQAALSTLRAHYKDNGGPSHAMIADSTGLSESTVQRYLSAVQIKTPNYSSIVSIAAVIGMETSDLIFGKDVVDILPKEDLVDLVMELRKMNIEELARSDEKWRERLDAENHAHSEDIRHLSAAHTEEARRADEAHAAHIERIQQMHNDQLMAVHASYKAQMEQMRTANSALLAQLQDAGAKHDSQLQESEQLRIAHVQQSAQQQIAHVQQSAQQQIDHIQQTASKQYEALEALAKTQKDADEKSKAYLKRQIRTWKIISFLLVFVLILLLVVDLKNPDRGWIKFIGGLKLFSMYGVA